MSDWNDDVQFSSSKNINENGGDADVDRGRSFGKGRGFVPQSFNKNDSDYTRSDFGGRGERRGRGGGGGGSGRGGFRSNDDRRGRYGNDSDDFKTRSRDSNWDSSNTENSSNRRFDGEDRRGRGGGRGRSSNEDRAWSSDNRKGDDMGSNDENDGEKKPEPVTYVPEDRTEEELFNETGITKGINFSDYESIQVNVTGENKPPPINTFQEAQLRDSILSNLNKCKYDKPTPIQKYAIPIIMDGRDLMATAQTGSGKTAAFLLPIINRLLSEQSDSDSGCCPRALILSPTRELAIQIKDNARLYTSRSFLKVEILYGGVATGHQRSRVSRGCDILIATPGRLLDFVQRGIVTFNEIKFIVLDEADRMLDMGFVSEIEKVMNHESMAPRKERQMLMFSATFSVEIQKLAAKYLRNYLFVAVGIVGGACKDVEQNFIAVEAKDKRTQLMALLEEEAYLDGTLLFVEQKRIADFIASFLSEKGFKATSIHGDRQQYQREQALRDFKSRHMSMLVATSVAARGLDISGVTHVINYDLPKEIDEYVHRIGRTGRLGNKGKATSFYDSRHDSSLASNLVRILKQANQKVPSFLEQDATEVGDYESGDFGGYDYRKNNQDGFKTDSRNQPQQIQDEEEW